MTEQAPETQPATVSETTQQAGEAQPPTGIRARWDWVEPAVWTERMLTALEEGVKGGKWFRLIDKVYALPNLRRAFARVKANQGAAGVDHATVEEFERDLEANLEKLSRSLADQRYRPQAVRRVWIPKPGSKEKRPLGIPTVRDRVVQAALRAVLEPIFERDFAAQSYGFRPKRGSKGALRFEITAHGKLAHSAYPELGHSAIHTLLDVLRAIRMIELPEDALLGRSTFNIGVIAGGRAPNVVADHAQAEIMFRTVGDPEEPRQAVKAAVAGPAEGREVLLEGAEIDPPAGQFGRLKNVARLRRLLLQPFIDELGLAVDRARAEILPAAALLPADAPLRRCRTELRRLILIVRHPDLFLSDNVS